MRQAYWEIKLDQFSVGGLNYIATGSDESAIVVSDSCNSNDHASHNSYVVNGVMIFLMWFLFITNVYHQKK